MPRVAADFGIPDPGSRRLGGAGDTPSSRSPLIWHRGARAPDAAVVTIALDALFVVHAVCLAASGRLFDSKYSVAINSPERASTATTLVVVVL